MLLVLIQACSATGEVAVSEAVSETVSGRGPVAAEAVESASQRTVADGVFTRGQALRGERRFQQTCAACHREFEITAMWFRAAAYSTVADMYRQISLTMPDGNPGSLSAAEYADIVAYILRVKEHPAGDVELPQDTALLDGIFLANP